MRKIIVDLNNVKDDEYSVMYEIFGLDVQNKSYEDFERRMLQIQIETIVEVGSHDELMKRNGFYTKLYNAQFEEA